jgi:small-conductance mechanosensitive channel
VQPTRPAVLLLVAACGLLLGWLLVVLVDQFSGARVPVSWVTAGLMAFLAVAMLVAARTVRGWVTERRYDDAMDPLRAARMVALAKAGAVFGAAVAGGYLGVAAALALQGSEYGSRTAPVALAVAATGVWGMGSGLYLERACISPGGGDDGATDAEGGLA